MTPHGRASSGTPGPIRVLVVDDSAVQRGALIALLAGDRDLEVVGWAANGADAIRAAAALKPDVITLDLRMPVMDGLEAARRIMQDTPTPIVVVTATGSADDRAMMAAAVQAGALAIVAKPAAGAGGKRAAGELLRTVKSMAQVKVIRRWSPERLAGAPAGAPAPVASAPVAAVPARPPDLVAIGASTGGPGALREILTALPATFAPPVLVVQHIAADFILPMVEWLRPQCPLPLHLACEGVPVLGPGIYIAPIGRHLIVRGARLALTDTPPLRGHRPSATVLFESVASQYGSSAVGVLLTGMGDDGARGLGSIKRAGGLTIAQDEASSAVFGMPAAAIALGAVDHILPPSGIAPFLLRLVAPGEKGES